MFGFPLDLVRGEGRHVRHELGGERLEVRVRLRIHKRHELLDVRVRGLPCLEEARLIDDLLLGGGLCFVRKVGIFLSFISPIFL